MLVNSKIISVAAWGLSILCPAIPSVAWTAILTALNNGDLVAADIEAFMALHHITTYSEPTDFPHPPPDPVPNNLIPARDIDHSFPSGKNGQ